MGRDIPESLKRDVRKRCGYGCIICGRIPYDYHHIIDYNIVLSHSLENIVLLCTEHHREITAKRLASSFITDALNRKPRGNETAQYSFLTQRTQLIKFGSNAFRSVFDIKVHFIFLNGHSLFSVRTEDGVPLFSADIKGTTGDSLFKLSDNTIEVQSGNAWDFNVSGTSITLHIAPRSRVIKMKIEDSTLILEELKIIDSGIAFDISETTTRITWKLGVASQSPNFTGTDNENYIPGGEAAFFSTPGAPFPSMAVIPERGYLSQEGGYRILFPSSKP